MSCGSHPARQGGFIIRSAFLIVPIFFLFFSYTSGFAGWKLIAQFPDPVNSSFFFNEQRGFVGTDNFDGIYRTSDGGKTWIHCQTPFAFSARPITDIFMKDSLNGWAGVEDQNTSLGLWYTNDGGITWRAQPNVMAMVTSVYQTSAAVIFADRWSTVISLSINVTNGIGNFTKSTPDRYNGINFVDDKHGVATTYANNALTGYAPAQWTNDGGLTWHPTQGIMTEAWGVYAQKGTPNFIIGGERWAGDPSLQDTIYASTDYGVTWQIVGFTRGRTTGHIAGAGTVVYKQYDVADWKNGMIRSTDGGRSWEDVGGPGNSRDTRFSVMGCAGGIVYAFDYFGGVWKTTDGGDGQIHEPDVHPNFSADHLDMSSDLCHYQLANLYFNNLTCNTLKIQSIGFIDSTDPAVSSGALSLSRIPALPATLDPTKSDYLTVSWEPKKFGMAKPLSTTYIMVHGTYFSNSVGLVSVDTLIPVSSQSFAFPPEFSLSALNVAFDSLNICNRMQDTIITYTNNSCDTLWLDTAMLSAMGDWQLLDPQSLQPLQLPIGLAPNESSQFLIRYTPSGTGAGSEKLKLHFTHQGLSKDITIPFTAFTYRKLSISATGGISLSSTSICTNRDTTLFFYNHNCDTLVIDSITNTNPQIFSDLSGMTFPIGIVPGDSLGYKITFYPLKNITSSSDIVFHYHLGSDTGSIVSGIKGFGAAGTSLFQTSLAAPQLIFGDRTSCSPPDSLEFFISNPGCDTLAVFGSQISGSGLPAISYRTEPALPKLLTNPNEKIRIVVYLQAALPSLNDGMLDVFYQTSDGISHDSLFQVHALVSAGEVMSLLSEQKVDLGDNRLCTDRDTSIVVSNPGCPDMTVKGVSLSGKYFYLKNTRSAPFTLHTGESQTISFVFSPGAPGSQNGWLQVETDANKNPIHTVPLTASATEIEHVHFRLEQQGTKQIYSGDTTMFAFIPDRDWSGKGLRKIDFSVSTDGDLIWYARKFSQANGGFSALTDIASLPQNRSQLNVHLSSPTEIVLEKDKPLVTFYYATALTDTINSPVTLSLLSLNDNDSTYRTCILSSQSQDNDFTLSLECGAKTFMNFMNGILPIQTDGAFPNPVTSESNYQAEIPFNAFISGKAEFTSFNALGKLVGYQYLQIDKPGKYSLHFDGAKIAGGMYDYTLRLGTNAAHGHIMLIK